MEEINKVREIIQQMNENLMEINGIEKNLDDISNLKGDESFYAPIHNGILIEGKLNTDKTLLVNVGNDTVVRKTIKETKELLEKQKSEINKALEQAYKELERLKNVQSTQRKTK